MKVSSFPTGPPPRASEEFVKGLLQYDVVYGHEDSALSRGNLSGTNIRVFDNLYMYIDR
jgi:hypothetical protein